MQAAGTLRCLTPKLTTSPAAFHARPRISSLPSPYSVTGRFDDDDDNSHSHNAIVWLSSLPTDARRLPSGLKARHATLRSWYAIRSSSTPVVASQTQIMGVLPLPVLGSTCAVATTRPLGCTHTAHTVSEWPVKNRCSLVSGLSTTARPAHG